MSDYDQRLSQWKAKQGIPADLDTQNEAELRMFTEEKASHGKCWCTFCDAHLPIREMRLITLRVDPYRQIHEGEGDYIEEMDRVRACEKCYKENYEQNQ